MLQLIVKEEVFGSGNTSSLPISFPSSKLTLAELIQQQVAAKVEQLNEQIKSGEISTRFLSSKERLLNAKAYKKQVQAVENAKLDPEKAGYDALAAFQQNAFFVLINGHQIEELEQELMLTADSEILFMRLMPLVGG